MLHTVYCCALYIISKLRPNTSQAVPKTEGKIFQAIPKTEGRILQAVPLLEGLPLKSFLLRLKRVFQAFEDVSFRQLQTIADK